MESVNRLPDAVICCSTGVPPTQLHKYSGMGGISVSAILEPLNFLLPQRETPLPDVDISTELSILTFETQHKEADGEHPDTAPSQAGLRESEETELWTEGQDREFPLDSSSL